MSGIALKKFRRFKSIVALKNKKKNTNFIKKSDKSKEIYDRIENENRSSLQKNFFSLIVEKIFRVKRFEKINNKKKIGDTSLTLWLLGLIEFKYNGNN